MSVYGATKAAIEALTRSWAAEFSDRGVRANAVMPGPTRTQTLMRLLGEHAQQMGDPTMLKRMAGAAEIAETVVFLAEPRSSFITRAVIPVDGGATAG